MPKRKKQFVRNWSNYNKVLLQRGSITFWIDKKVFVNWSKPRKTKKRGRPYTYSDELIESLLIIRSVYRLKMRQTIGFVKSFFVVANLKLALPEFSILSRRPKNLKVKLPVIHDCENIHLVVDSTGLKVYGEGEWKRKVHGFGKHRMWMKLHLGINEKDNEIKAVRFTTNEYTDAEVVPDLLEQFNGKLGQFSGDRAYDRFKVYKEVETRGGKTVVPPRKNARIGLYANGKSPPAERDKNLLAIKKQGLKKWKKVNNYHRRSLAETGMFRYKNIFGDQLCHKIYENQVTETLIKCKVLNIMNRMVIDNS
jgi:hypothetical protein